jgi:endonuclease YncB( thermonuclease family)
VDIDTWPQLFGRRIPVRVRGINCPERSATDPDESLRAINAHAYTKAAVTNAREILLLNVQRCKYFRLVADVFIDGLNLGEMLITAGLADRVNR